MVDKRFHREGGGSFDGRLYFLYLKFTFIALHLQKKKLEGGVRTQKKKKRWRGGGAQIFCNPSAPYDIKWNSPQSLHIPQIAHVRVHDYYNVLYDALIDV